MIYTKIAFSSNKLIAIFWVTFNLETNVTSLSMGLVGKTKCLELQIEKNLTWDFPVKSITKKVVSALSCLVVTLLKNQIDI